MKKERIDTYNAWRGICAIGILFSHMSYLSSSTNPFWHSFHQLFMRHGAICTSFFFICSGFFLHYSWKEGQNFGNYVKNKLKRLYPITLIVFILAVMVNILLSKDTDMGKEVAIGSSLWFFNILANIFLFKAFIPSEKVFYSFHGPSWYISVLFVFFLIGYWFVRGLYGKQREKYRKIILSVCTCAYLIELAICIIVKMNNWDYLYPCYVNPYFRIFGEGFLGIIICEYMPEIQEYIKNININILEITSFVIFLASFFLKNIIHLNIYPAWIQIIPMGFILIAFRSERGVISKVLKSGPLQFIGKISFELYMTHAFVYEGLPVAIGFVSKNFKNWIIYHAGTRFVITFVLCIVFAYIVNLFMKFLNKKIISKI